MRRSYFVPMTFLGILGLMVLGFSQGCQDQRTQWAVGNTLLSQSESVLATAHRTGALSDKAAVAIDPSIQASRTALDTADKELTANNDQPTDEVAYLLKIANATLTTISKPPKAGK